MCGRERAEEEGRGGQGGGAVGASMCARAEVWRGEGDLGPLALTPSLTSPPSPTSPRRRSVSIFTSWKSILDIQK